MKAMTEQEARQKASACGLGLYKFMPKGAWSGRFGAGYREEAEERAGMKPGLWLVEEDDGVWVVLQPVPIGSLGDEGAAPRIPKDCEKWDW